MQKLVVLSRTTKTYSRLGTNGIRGFAHSSVVTRALPVSEVPEAEAEAVEAVCVVEAKQRGTLRLKM